MRNITPITLLALLLATACTSTKDLNYFQNLPETNEPQYFPYELTDYRVKYRDVLYVDVKTLTPEGKIENALQQNIMMTSSYAQGESSAYLMGYNIDMEGNILLPVIGEINVAGQTLPEIRNTVQQEVDSVLNHAYVDVKLLGYKFTVMGEARNPGTFVNYNDYMTVLDAVGRAGGVSDFGHRDRILVVRSNPEGSKTYRLDLKDKNLLSSEAYFMQPNDVIIIEPLSQKIFYQNLPTLTFIITTITGVLTTTLLLIDYFNYH